jgi:DNA replication protein DnaC
MWAKLAEQSDREGWPAARFLAARLPAGKTLATFDFEAVPMVSKAQVTVLASGDARLEMGANILLFRPPGGSKSHLSAALGLALVENGWRVMFARTSRATAPGRSSQAGPRKHDRQVRPLRCQRGFGA